MDGGKIKILQIGCENFGVGGRSTVAYNLTEKLDSDTYAIDFLSDGRTPMQEYETKIKQRGGKVIVVRTTKMNAGRLGKEWERYKLIRDCMKEEQYHIVHIHADHAWEAMKSALIAKVGRIKKIIVHAHNTGIEGDISISKKLIIFISQRMLPYIVNKKLACSMEAASFLYGKHQIKDVVIIKNGIDIKKYLFDDKTRKRVREQENLDDNFVIGCIGRLTAQKNPFFLIDTFEKILKKNPQALLLWIGDGVLRPKLEKKIQELKLQNAVRLLGNRYDVAELLQAMDLFVLPSLYEGFGIVNLEAQASGLPCVVSDTIPESAKVNDNFYQLPLEKGVSYWADFIIKCDPTRDSCNIKKKFYMLGYDLDSNIKLLNHIYREVLT